MRATRLPPMRNTTGPHRARHSVFRHPATMPDKAGVEVYRYARRPVDSLVCVGPIRGTGNASMRSCCALYGYVSGSHAVHSRWRKSGPFSVLRLPRRHRSTPDTGYSASGHRTRSRGIGASRPRLRFCNPGSGVGCVRINDHGNRSAQFPYPFDSIDARTQLVASASIAWRTKSQKSA